MVLVLKLPASGIKEGVDIRSIGPGLARPRSVLIPIIVHICAMQLTLSIQINIHLKFVSNKEFISFDCFISCYSSIHSALLNVLKDSLPLSDFHWTIQTERLFYSKLSVRSSP